MTSCLFRAHSCLLRAPVPCARLCGGANHGLPTVWALVCRGCPCRDSPVCPPVPRQDGIGDKAPTLCCACVASSWHAHSTIWNCGVGNVCADCHEMSAPPLEWAECERCCRPKCPTPHSRKRTGYFSPNRPTWKMKRKIRRMKRKMRETAKSAKWRVEENQDAQPHEKWVTRCGQPS